MSDRSAPNAATNAPADDCASLPDPALGAAFQALREHFTFHPQTDPEGIAHNAIAVLRNLPEDQRMEAMGMVFYGEVEWDDEAEQDVVTPVVDDVVPGANLYVDSGWVG